MPIIDKLFENKYFLNGQCLTEIVVNNNKKKEVEKKILEKIFGKKIFEISWRGAVNQNLKKDG